MKAAVLVVCVLAALAVVNAGPVDLRRKRSPQQRFGNYGQGPVVPHRQGGFPGGYNPNSYQNNQGFQRPGLIGGFNQNRPINGGYNPGYGRQPIQPSFSGSQSQSSSNSQTGGGRGGQSGSSSSSSSQTFNSGGRGGLSGSSSQSSSSSNSQGGGGGRRPGASLSGSQSSSSSNSFSTGK